MQCYDPTGHGPLVPVKDGILVLNYVAHNFGNFSPTFLKKVSISLLKRDEVLESIEVNAIRGNEGVGSMHITAGASDIIVPVYDVLNSGYAGYKFKSAKFSCKADLEYAR